MENNILSMKSDVLSMKIKKIKKMKGIWGFSLTFFVGLVLLWVLREKNFIGLLVMFLSAVGFFFSLKKEFF